MTLDDLEKQVEKDLQAINDRMPAFKSIHHFFLSQEPMIKTTTGKIKRNLETARIREIFGE